MWASYFQLSDESQEELSRYVLPSGYRVVSAASLPSAFPRSFREKIDSAVLIAQPTSTGGIYMAFNNLRIDVNDRTVDQHPFGFFIHTTGIASVGVFVHHGNWIGRTVQPPPELWTRIANSGIGDYFYSFPPAGKLSGPLADLPTDHRQAFDAAILYLRKSTAIFGEND